jgi:hypothetical protein
MMAKSEVSPFGIPQPGARYDFEGLPTVAVICRGISPIDDSVEMSIYEVVTTNGHMAGYHTIDDFMENGPDSIPDSTLGAWLSDVVAKPIAMYTLYQLATVAHEEVIEALFNALEES